MTYKDLTKRLKKEAGWKFIRQGKGSHEIWGDGNGVTFSIPKHGSKDISTGIVNAALKKAGLK